MLNEDGCFLKALLSGITLVTDLASGAAVPNTFLATFRADKGSSIGLLANLADGFPFGSDASGGPVLMADRAVCISFVAAPAFSADPTTA